MNLIKNLLGLFGPKPDPSIPADRCSSEKCPKCGHWATRDDPHEWRYDANDPDGPVEVMSCTCGHESRWIMGPGIMICVDENIGDRAAV